MSLILISLSILAFILLISIRVVYDYQEGIKFTLGRFTNVVGGGITFVIPILQTMKKVDIRVRTIDVPKQECITKDNVTVTVDAVAYYKIKDAKRVILNVENYFYATSQLSQTTMRNVIGEVTLDELLANRESISEKIKNIVDRDTDPWGIEVVNVELKFIELPDNLKRVMAREAEAEREKRGIIIKSEGDVIASKKFAEAATTLAKSPGAMELRNLQTLNDIASDPSAKFIIVPMDVFDYIRKR